MKTELFQKLMLSYLNIPYIFGGKNVLSGEDCSGLVCELLKAVGMLGTNEELSSQQLYSRFLPMTRTSEPLTGSLVFYGKSQTEIDHVGMFIDSQFILEAGHGTADTLTKQIAEQRGAYSRVRPYTYRTDFVAIVSIDLGLVP